MVISSKNRFETNEALHEYQDFKKEVEQYDKAKVVYYFPEADLHGSDDEDQ
jgi:hypothetical protein